MTRASRNAAMFRTYGRAVWQHNTPPMTEARRQQLYGNLQPMDDKLPGDGEWQWMLPWITLASGFVMALIVWGILA